MNMKFEPQNRNWKGSQRTRQGDGGWSLSSLDLANSACECGLRVTVFASELLLSRELLTVKLITGPLQVLECLNCQVLRFVVTHVCLCVP